MKETLDICMLQCDLHWESPINNRAQIELYLEEVIDVDVILLPELFTTGFSVDSTHLAESMDGDTVAWMKSISEKKNSVLCGSIMVKENGHTYNRLLWVEPEGQILHYDKRHLFSLSSEGTYFTAGTSRLIVEYKGWKICPMICYDLRFPVFSRNDVGYDLLLFVANWPEKRISAWDALLKARAIENQAYVLGLNRVGTDGNKLKYSGHSQALDVDGGLISIAPENEIGFVALTLSKSHLTETRKHFPFLEDRDNYSLTN